MPDIRFRDHAEFHGQVLRSTLACAGLAAAVATLESLSGRSLPLSALAASGGVALAWGLAPPRSARAWIHALGAVGLATLVGLLAARRDLALGGALFGAALGLYAGASLERLGRAIAVLAGALAVPLAGQVAQALLDLGVGALVHPALGHGLVGGAFGFVAGTVAGLGRQLFMRRDPVENAYAAARSNLRGELLELTERGVETRRRVLAALAGRPAEERGPLAKAVDELALKVIAVAARFGEVDRDGQSESAEALVARIDALGRKIEETEDPVARGHWRTAHDALLAQLGHVRQISVSRERAMARLASYQATLERLHLAAVHHRTADTERFAAEMRPIMDQLSAAGRDLECDAHGIGESTAAADEVMSAQQSGASASSSN
ncbi:MAG TPA: hypothetical protein VKN99_21715 [Polyangia bacterium]|nr:hypothetical protein [Polyangia bacterium]